MNHQRISARTNNTTTAAATSASTIATLADFEAADNRTQNQFLALQLQAAAKADRERAAARKWLQLLVPAKVRP
jgi:hypothetical protein